MRVFGGTVTGGGTLSVPTTAGDAFDPAHPTDPDNTLKLLGNLGLAGTTLVLGSGAELSGVGAITGTGALRLAGARLRGAVTHRGAGHDGGRHDQPDGRLGQERDGPARRRHLRGRWRRGRRVRRWPSTAAPGSSSQPGQTLTLPPGSTLSSDGCCTNPGQLVVNGRLKVSGARLQWVTLAGSGEVVQEGVSTWDLAGSAFSAGATIVGSGTIDGDLPSGAATLKPTGALLVTGTTCRPRPALSRSRRPAGSPSRGRRGSPGHWTLRASTWPRARRSPSSTRARSRAPSAAPARPGPWRRTARRRSRCSV